MDNEKIKAIAREYAEDVFRKFRERNINHLTDEEWQLSIDEVAKDTIDAFQWLSKTHCIVEKEVIQDDYADVKKAVAKWESSELAERDDYFEYGRVFGNKEVLESYFSKDDLIGKEDKQ